MLQQLKEEELLMNDFKKYILYRVFIKYCVISKILKYIPDSGFPSVSVCVHNGRSNTSAAAELAEFRKITTF